jgi:mono/diheme cytochrome c family protein
MDYRFSSILIKINLFLILIPNILFALPFNDDMVHDQYKVSEVMRDRPSGSVALGSSKRYVTDRNAALSLKNPVPFTKSSIARGNRLWEQNCTPCHGRYTGKAHPDFPSMAVFEKPIDPAVAGATSGPQLVSKTYIEDPSKSDGHIFGYIYFGGLAIMPRLGYKLSPGEIWDIVNYVRDMQRDFRGVLGLKEVAVSPDVDEDDSAEDVS